ncbi:hypothetical protein D3C76_1358050 [compost metagenome]
MAASSKPLMVLSPMLTTTSLPATSTELYGRPCLTRKVLTLSHGLSKRALPTGSNWKVQPCGSAVTTIGAWRLAASI